MKNRRSIRGMLHNFLSTFTSRYSDYDGYWIFGLIFDSLGALTIDLLKRDAESENSVLVNAASWIAVQKFRQQMEKAGFDVSDLREVRLVTAVLNESYRGVVNGRFCSGRLVRFTARVVFEDGRPYERHLSVFVAPHNPEVETRSTRRIHRV